MSAYVLRVARAPFGWLWTLSLDGFIWWHGHGVSEASARADGRAECARLVRADLARMPL